MSSAVDTAILEALGLDASNTTISPQGVSGFASTFKLSTKVDGRPRSYFIKTGSGVDAETMFKGEHTSLNAIADAVPDFCPRSHAHGPMQTPGRYFLATDFLQLGASPSPSPSDPPAHDGSGLSLAAKLARLHSTTGPTSHADGPVFGFPVPTCCGKTVQDNTWKPSWAEFYADNRLRGILAACSAGNSGADAELAAAVETVAGRVVPRLLGEGRVAGMVPVLVHGDLWSGNHARGRIAGGSGAVGEVVYDPSAVYGHAEYELGIMRMFGGFDADFWAEYHRLVPKAEPREEWEDRVALYELYHHLNHYAMFGGGYRSGAMSIMKRLIAKYGKE